MARLLRGVLVLLALLALTLPVAGCKRFRKPAPDASVSEPDELDTETDDDKKDEQLANKVGEYIRNCMNAMSANLYHSRRVYASWAPKTGITGRETKVLGVPTVAGAAKCLLAANKAKSMPPDERTLEDVGLRYARAVVAAEDVIKEASSYYEQKAFETDHFAKGKALHPRLVAAFDEFMKADQEIHKEIGAITKPLAQRQLSQIEKEEGKKFRWHRRNVLNLARDLVEIGDPGDEEEEVLGSAYDESVTVFDKALTELRDYGSLHRADLTNVKKSKIGASMAYDNFVRAAEEYLKKARDYGRCLRTAPASAKTKEGKVDLDKLPRCPDGGTHEFGEKYDHLIITSNTNPFPH